MGMQKVAVYFLSSFKLRNFVEKTVIGDVYYKLFSLLKLQVHWGQHPLRPEFLESTYLLYEATSDPYYLHVGEQVLKSLQKHAWVPCGYAAVKDVRTGAHEDRSVKF